MESKMAKKHKTIKEGDFFRSLEASLQHLNVKRQAYHGGTFIGNHVHKLLKVWYFKLHCKTTYLIFL